MDQPQSVTQILQQIEQGDTSAAEHLLPLVYDELRRLASAKLAQEKPGQTLQATALVHEAYLRLVKVDHVRHWDSRGHFFAAAAVAIQRILVEDRSVPGVSATVIWPVTESPGDMVGPYKLLQQIGEGGMGVVWMAEQQQPVRRRVALKVIKPGMDSKAVLARFEAERQALAMMDHQNIARVLDAGATESGRPFFVMELVHGVPITTFCEKNRCSVRQRLELFIPVCQAIQHAHQKGIIHRDIKPTNVLVTIYDDKPVPKVIDFGIAKAVDQRLTERTLFTQYGTMVGTLEYMPPEQAELNAFGVDTRSDVYSLGALLYELLTGTPPLDRSSVREMAWNEVLRKIQEDEPLRPSLRLSSSASLPQFAEICHTTPAALPQMLSRELDWIVMKCLEKDRTRRYETANGLARDIQRFLKDEPVEACPPTALYRMRKLTRKHRSLLTTAASFAALLVVASVVSICFAVWATQAQQQAEAALENERRSRDEAQQERQVAEENFQRARDAVDTLFTKVSESRLVNRPGLQPLRKELLESALAYYQEFIEIRQDDPRLQKDLAAAHSRVASITSQIGSPKRATEEFNKASALLERLATDTDPESQRDLAKLYDQFARLQRTVGNTSEAERLHRKAIDMWTSQIEKYPDRHRSQQALASSYNDLGRVYDSLQETDLAIDCYQRAILVRDKLAKAHPDEPWFPTGYNNLARIYHQQGRYAEARNLYEQGIRILQVMLQDFAPDDLHNQFQLANYYQNLAVLCSDLGQDNDALELSRKSIALEEGLVRENPEVLDWQDTLAYSYYTLSRILNRTGQAEEALLLEEKSLELHKALSQRTPDAYRRPAYWSRIYLEFARRQLDAGMRTNAERSWTHAAELARFTPEKDRSAADWSCLGRALYYLEDFENAKVALEQSSQLPNNSALRDYDPAPWYLLMTLHGLGETDQAQSLFNQLSKELEEQPSAGPYQLEAATVLGLDLQGDLSHLLIKTGQRHDPDYQPTIAQPTFLIGKGPSVVVDAGHNNFHTIDGRYQGFARLLRSDGYVVGSLETKFTADSLKDVDVLVIANACADNIPSLPNNSGEDADPSAFTQLEIECLTEWVREGGSLLLITDHKPYADGAKTLAATFGIEMTGGYVVEQGRAQTIAFERSAGRLGEHPVFEGRNENERIDRVVTFAGQAFRSTANLRPLLVLGEDAVLTADRVRNLPTDAERVSVKGWLQGAAGELGQGRIAVFGEAGMFSAQISATDGGPMGMNAPHATQNRVLPASM